MSDDSPEKKGVRVFGGDGFEDTTEDAWDKLSSSSKTTTGTEKAVTTQQADVDSHSSEDWYEPPYDPTQLLELLERHETHAAACSAKAKNVAGFGFELVPHESAESDQPGGFETVRQFWHGPQSRFQLGPDNQPAAPHDVLEHAWIDHETVGWGALEILANPQTGAPTGLAHVPAHSIRRRKAAPGYVQLDEQGEPIRFFGSAGDRYPGGSTSAPPVTEGEGDGDGTSIPGAEGGGDPLADRQVFTDAATGEWGESAGEVNIVANELLVIRNYSALSPHYGTPDVVPALQTMEADVAARRHNTTFFQNDAVPRFAVVVEGGELTEQSWNDLEETFQNLKTQENSHRGVLIEAANMAATEFGDENGVNIRIERLTVGITEDADFLEFRDHNERNILQAHSVPPVVAGVLEDVNYATASAQQREFAQTTIRPRQERLAARLYDIIHRIALGVPGWSLEFELYGAENKLEESEIAYNRARAMKQLTQSGILTVREARSELGYDTLTDQNGQERPENEMLAGTVQPGGSAASDAVDEAVEEATEAAREDERNSLIGYSITDRVDAESDD